MKMKKMITSILMGSILCIALTGCSGKTEKTAEEANSNLVAGVLEQNSIEKSSRVHFVDAKANGEEIKKQTEYKAFSSLNTMLMELSAGRVDYLKLPSSVANYVAAGDDKLIIKEGEGSLALRHYHMAASADDTHLCDEMNSAIDALKADGTLDQLVADFITGSDGEPVANTLVKKEGAETHVVAVTGDLPPLDFVSADGTPAGFNVALLNAISDKIGCNFEIVQLDAAARLSALESGKVDLIFWIGCFSSDGFEPETDNVCLSAPYYEESVCLVGNSSDVLDQALSKDK